MYVIFIFIITYVHYVHITVFSFSLITYVHICTYLHHFYSVLRWHGLKVARVLRSGKAGGGVVAGPLKVACVGALQHILEYC